MKKTNVIRLLEFHKIEFDVFEYEVDEEKLDAISVAEKICANPDEVFKTLVAVSNENDHFVFVIPGNYELNLKKAASAANVKKIELIKMKDLLDITGYIRGGCSPIGMKKSFPTFVDETAYLFDKIYISSGARGMQLYIKPSDLIMLTEASLVDVV